MRILYIYHEEYGRRKRYKLEMEKLGHDVISVDVSSCLSPEWNPKILDITGQGKNGYDVIWLLSPLYLEYPPLKNLVDYFKSERTLLVTYSSFDPSSSPESNDHIWSQFDVFFCQHLDFTNYLEELGVNVHYIPIGFYKHQYYPIDVKKTMGISFAGVVSNHVSKYLEALTDFDIKIFGTSMSNIQHTSYYSHEEQNNIYARSKINLDIPFINGVSLYTGLTEIKNRFFEIPASKQFLLTMKSYETSQFFDETMVGFYKDIDTMREAVSRYMKDDRLRKTMAEKSYKEVISKHTFSQRFKSMFQILWEM